MHNTGLHLILTAVSPTMWNDYLVFYDSIRKFGDYRIVVIDLELTEDQQTELRQQINVHHTQISDEELKQFKTIGEHWRQWHKPSFILKCIEQCNPSYLLWLDVDLVVLDYLEELWKHTYKQFLVVQDYFAPLTCINDNELYDKYPCPVNNPKDENIALNSGVLGFEFPRDTDILRTWQDKVKIVTDDTEIKSWIKLFDQGALLWALRDMQRLNLVQQEIRWNYPAKRNPYELHTASINPDGSDFRWPIPDSPRIGGDIQDNILLDNYHNKPIVAHFAGAPKLNDLCNINDPKSVTYFRQRRHIPTRRIFCVGLVRAGTHAFAEIIRRSATVECWVRHEHQPPLAREAMLKFSERHYKTKDFHNRMKIFSRVDCGIVCESNHRLGFFIQDINEQIKFASFILFLRNPIELVRSRLLNFAMWFGYITRMPSFYQFDFFELRNKFGIGSPYQNLFRIQPSNFSMDPIDLHLWEITETLKITLRQLRDLPDNKYRVFWIEDLKQHLVPLAQYIGENIIDIKKLRHHANIRYGQQCIEARPETKEWIDQLVKKNVVKILSTVEKTLQEFDIDTHTLTMI